MAKFLPGPIIGAISGSIGGSTYSKNRYGLYVRNRSIPVNPGTKYQLSQRGAIAAISQSWQYLSPDEQQAWRTWAQNNPVTDALGSAQVLTGHAAYVRINTRLAIAGDDPNTDPPAGGLITQLQTFTLTADIGAGDFEVGFTPTPLGANNRLIVWAAVVNSPGIRYVNNLWKSVYTSAKNAATDIDIQSEVEERFGSLSVGQVVHVKGVVLESTKGLYSAPFTTQATVVST